MATDERTPALPQASLIPSSFPRAERAYVALAAIFVSVLVLTNIVGVKLFVAFPGWLPEGLFGAPLTLTTGILTYPITFLVTDVVSELWGRKRADFMVVLGFLASMGMLAVVQLAVVLPGSPAWVNAALGMDDVQQMQVAFESVFTLPGTLVGASMTAYLVAQLLDVRLYEFWRRFTDGRHLWLRNNGSTWISQLFDTVIVNGIFLTWGLGLAPRIVFEIIVTCYLCKLVLAALDTPLIYGLVALLRRYLETPETEHSGSATAPGA